MRFIFNALKWKTECKEMNLYHTKYCIFINPNILFMHSFPHRQILNRIELDGELFKECTSFE